MRADLFRAVARKVADPRQTFPAAANQQVRAAVGIGADPDDYDPLNRYYVRVGGTGRRQDQPDSLRRAALERSTEFADINPLFARYLTFVLDWTRPAEFRPRAKDPRVDAVVQRFWSDPRNGWRSILGPLMRAKMCSGLVALPAMVDVTTADVVVDYWDPLDIGAVEFASGSNRIRATIEYLPSKKKGVLAEHPIVRPWRPSPGDVVGNPGRLQGRHPKDAAAQNTLAGVLYFAFNCPPNAAYGRGDFFPGLDYLTLLDDLHHAYADRAQMLARIPGSVGVANAGEVEAVKNEIQKLQGYASVLVHTIESVVPNLGAPSSGAAEAKEQERMLRVYGASPTGIPPHLLSGDFTEGNRAIAAGTSEPVALRGASQQDDLASVIETACRYAVDTVLLLQPKRLEGVEDWSIEVERPRLLVDPSASAATLGTLGQALDSAVAARRMDEQTAREIFVRAVNELGVSVARLDEIEARLPDTGRAAEEPTLEPTLNASKAEAADGGRDGGERRGGSERR